MLNKASLDNESKPLLLRGLVNKANWCYINATLQALLVCPPFFNLMRQVELIPEREASTSTPILDSIPLVTTNINPCMVVIFGNLYCPALLFSANTGKTPKSDFRTGPNLEPSYIGKMLATIESTLSAKGHQEDAEEFLSCLLNGIHEEMIVLSKLDPPLPKPESHESSEGVQDDLNIVAVEGQTMDKEEEDAGDWEQVGPRNKSSITRVASFPSSLISDIFGGCLRSSVHQTGAKESANVEPFFCLQLDIQNVSCIEDALNHLTVKEELQGFTCSKTNAQIDVSRRVSFEVLPKVLILHLKRFIYSKNGSQKLQKHVDYPLELVIGRELLSPNVKGKYTLPKKTYKLCAVVYHHGKISSGGHYTADILHPTHGWVHTDDTKLKLVSSSFVLKPSPSKNPYLLYYRRADQIMK
ncbi:predicted protein [Nematostella vectensis]|uniref:Ubiquitin carboxyl-terminal hydrolase n=1 Tax=Nematostella vectensis TaxID=45351 RepID=A7S704_NEMVE|nr:predicted protein [Nematostella vectensis]|eukprot:XP_001632582.1 predicted protein [Nematostella vectensis]